MRICKAYLKSVSPMSQGKYIGKKGEKELDDDFERRAWRNRMHTNDEGNVIIPPMAFANCVKEAAKYLGLQIPGRGKEKFTKNFDSGVLVLEPLVLSIKAKDVQGDERFVPADGRPGGPRRVFKVFPVIPKWEGWVSFYIFDDMIPRDVFEYVLNQAGNLIGVGSFRVRNRGFFGRFDVVKVEWSETK